MKVATVVNSESLTSTSLGLLLICCFVCVAFLQGRVSEFHIQWVIRFVMEEQTNSRNNKTRESETYVDLSRLLQRRQVHTREIRVVADLLLFRLYWMVVLYGVVFVVEWWAHGEFCAISWKVDYGLERDTYGDFQVRVTRKTRRVDARQRACPITGELLLLLLFVVWWYDEWLYCCCEFVIWFVSEVLPNILCVFCQKYAILL